MKRIHYIAIVVILLIVAGLFIMSPYSPLNKTSISGHSIKLPTGYTVKNSTEYSLKIDNANNSNPINIYAHKQSDINKAINEYKKEHNETFNITQTDAQIDTKEKVIRTRANRYNDTKAVIYKYWFVKDGKVFDIQTNNHDPNTVKIIKSIISSM